MTSKNEKKLIILTWCWQNSAVFSTFNVKNSSLNSLVMSELFIYLYLTESSFKFSTRRIFSPLSLLLMIDVFCFLPNNFLCFLVAWELSAFISKVFRNNPLLVFCTSNFIPLATNNMFCFLLFLFLWKPIEFLSHWLIFIFYVNCFLALFKICNRSSTIHS